MSARDEIKGAMSRYIRALGWDRQEAESMASLGLDAVLALPLPDRLALARALVAGDGFSVGRLPMEAGRTIWAGRMTAEQTIILDMGRSEGWNACRVEFLAAAK